MNHNGTSAADDGSIFFCSAGDIFYEIKKKIKKKKIKNR